MYSIATNQAIDILRRERRHRRAAHDGAGSAGKETGPCSVRWPPVGRLPTSMPAVEEERRQMQAAVRKLTTVQRSAVELIHRRRGLPTGRPR